MLENILLTMMFIVTYSIAKVSFIKRFIKLWLKRFRADNPALHRMSKAMAFCLIGSLIWLDQNIFVNLLILSNIKT